MPGAEPHGASASSRVARGGPDSVLSTVTSRPVLIQAGGSGQGPPVPPPPPGSPVLPLQGGCRLKWERG